VATVYLKPRCKTYWAFHDIPADVRQTFGKKRFKATLKTHDRATAERRGAVVEARWRAEIAQARAQARGRKEGLDAVERDAEFIRRSLDDWPKGEAQRVFRVIDGLRDEIGAARVNNWPISVPVPEDYKDRLWGLVSGKLVRTVERLDEYCATLAGKREARTVFMKRATITAFAAQFRYLADIERAAVQAWVNRQAECGKAVATIRRALSELRGYWRYLQACQVVEDERRPFDGDRLHIPESSKTGKRERKPFTASEVVMLHGAALAVGDQQLADLIQLAMYTGARRGELCGLRCANIHGDYFEIIETTAKTKASRRQVPIHSKLQATVARLLKASRDGFLLSGLGANKFARRGGALGHRFARLKRAQNFGPAYVFHSIRHTVATLLEDAEVLENIAADILGHEKGTTLSFRLYSGGASLAVKRKAIEKLRYPTA
jgi:integrase